MRLGTDTGSLINHVSSNLASPEPAVGLGATLLGWTDRQAATVVEILPKGIVKVQADTATRTDGNGMSDSQTYAYAPNPAGATYHFRRDPFGKYHEVLFNAETKRWKKTGGKGLRLGVRDHHHDFSF